VTVATELPPVFPPQLQPLATEVRTYFRELPRLLDAGHDRRFVVVKGDALYGVWDTQRDAIQAGRDRFPEGGFLAQEIDRRVLTVLGGHFTEPASVTLAY
jgi:hypothetical protein